MERTSPLFHLSRAEHSLVPTATPYRNTRNETEMTQRALYPACTLLKKSGGKAQEETVDEPLRARPSSRRMAACRRLMDQELPQLPGKF